MHSLIRYILYGHGSWYALTGIWALLHLESFLRVTGSFHNPFKTQANGALFLALGIFFFWTAKKKKEMIPVSILAGALAIALFAIDFKFLMRGEIGAIFWVAALEELLAASLIVTALVVKDDS